MPPGGSAGKRLTVYLHGRDDQRTEAPPDGFSLTRVADEMGFVPGHPIQDQPANEHICHREPSSIASITTTLIYAFALDRSRVYLGGYAAGAPLNGCRERSD